MRFPIVFLASFLILSISPELRAQTTEHHAHLHDTTDTAAPAHHLTREELSAWLTSLSSHGRVIPETELSAEAISAAATKTFNIVARQFVFDVTPSPFVVNQGDTVTINVSVPSNDASPSGHGFLMDTYQPNGFDLSRGQSKSVTFVATTPGTYGFICTQASCGVGHSSMYGQMTVNAVTVPAPTISSISPSNASSAGGALVTISGSNFQSGATVLFGTRAATNVTVSATSITATVPAGTTGPVTVRVTNPDNQSATVAFTYSPAGPTISAVSPSTGPTSGNTLITISGNGFAPGATVTVGGIAATNVTVVNGSTITATTPLGPANESVVNARDVVVTNADGASATKSAAFTYSVPALAITGIAPSAGLPAGGTIVTISGAGFTTAATTSVLFGGVPGTKVTVLDAVTLHVTAPAHAAGVVNVAVTVGGSTVSSLNGFTFATPLPKNRAARH